MAKIPIGPWAKDPTLKELGRLEHTHMQMAVASHTLALFTRALNYSKDQADILMEGVKGEFRIETFDSLLATGLSLVENLSMLRDCINDAAVNKTGVGLGLI